MKRPPSVTWECVPCRETYFSKHGGPCHVCGQPVTVRPEGAEPYGGPDDEDEALAELPLFAAAGAATPLPNVGPVGGG